MEKAKFLYRHRIIQLAFEQDLLAQHDLTTDTFDLLLSYYLVTESEKRDSVPRRMVSGFMNKYFKEISLYRRNKMLDHLHECNYLYITTVRSAAITKMGKITINKIYEHLHDFERHLARPVLLALREGKMKLDGNIISAKNIPKKETDNPYNPYIGVHQLHNGMWGAYVKPHENNMGEELVGKLHKRAFQAAKARDAYIKEHKLKFHELSIKINK